MFNTLHRHLVRSSASSRALRAGPIAMHGWTAALLLCAALWLPARQAFAAPHILVLHSYSQEYPWTRGQHDGFVQALDAGAADQPVLSTEYLDTKRRAYTPAYAQTLANSLRVKYADYTPSAIYVTDDDALLFARDYLALLFPGTPVFFSGVNNYEVGLQLDPSRFTGVFQRKEIRPNIEALLQLEPKLEEVVFVGDGSNVDKGIVSDARDDLRRFPSLHARFIGERRLDKVIEKLQQQKSRYVVLTTLGGMTDADGDLLPLTDIVRAIAQQGYRIVSTEDAYVRDGVLGGYVTRGPDQGAATAKLVLEHLRGKPISALRALLESPNAYVFDDRALEAQGLDLPPELAAKSVVLNPRKRSFVEKHATLILGSLYALAAALFVTILTMLYVVSRKNAQLTLARQAAEAANRAKSQFLANMSHDIRTPLTSIIGFAELLLQTEGDTPERRDAVQPIIRNGRHLLDLINDILDIAKVESGSLQLESVPVELPTLLNEVKTLVAGRVQHKSVEFKIDLQMPLPQRFVSDPVRLKQVLVNLLGNALKFTEAGTVQLRIRYVAAPVAQLCFTVTDTGIGISPEQLSRLFKPFSQADVSTTRRFGGSGLGLHLCRQLALAMGGSVEVESEVGRGSSFHLNLPLAEAPDTLVFDAALLLEAARPALPDFQLPKLRGRVLLAEDGLDNQRLISAYVKQTGLDIKVVANGREAVESALGEEFDLILMDVQMPEMDGVSATELLRGLGYMRPIVALTANVMPAEVQHYRDVGCDLVLHKPIDRPSFYRALSDLTSAADSAAPALDAAMQDELADLARDFRARLPAQLDAIDQALAAQDWPALKLLAHTMKGTAGGFGMPSLTTIAGQLEAAVKAASYDEAAALCTTLREDADRALAVTN